MLVITLCNINCNVIEETAAAIEKVHTHTGTAVAYLPKTNCNACYSAIAEMAARCCTSGIFAFE